MCIQIDKKWSCGHTGFHNVRWCPFLGRGCKGTKAEHEIVDEDGMCGDCIARARDPNPRPEGEQNMFGPPGKASGAGGSGEKKKKAGSNATEKKKKKSLVTPGGPRGSKGGRAPGPQGDGGIEKGSKSGSGVVARRRISNQQQGAEKKPGGGGVQRSGRGGAAAAQLSTSLSANAIACGLSPSSSSSPSQTTSMSTISPESTLTQPPPAADEYSYDPLAPPPSYDLADLSCDTPQLGLNYPFFEAGVGGGYGNADEAGPVIAGVTEGGVGLNGQDDNWLWSLNYEQGWPSQT